MVVANIIQPGKGLNIDPTTLANDKVADYVEKAHDATLVDFFMNIIPKTLISPLAEGSILQVLFVAVLFGIALAAIGDRGRPIVDILNNLTAPVFYLVGMLMKLAPIGAFGAMAFTIGAYGIEAIGNLLITDNDFLHNIVVVYTYYFRCGSSLQWFFNFSSYSIY